ncbi:hypothetical protein OPV22_016201 [Ensete ventricosum]|uniref:Retrotransposon gag domain-containing protein n=1 Tax=Ensete ventricosum TaxID=4639 RepID=A0AAV8PDU4_ENSVE|nr:hypothetical protein OPV22_016201 [Ensete ventricosum]
MESPMAPDRGIPPDVEAPQPRVAEVRPASPTPTPARSQSRSYNPSPTELDLDTLSTDSTDSLREQVRRVHQQLDEVQKEVLRSREEIGENSKGGSPFTPKIQSKPLPATFRLPALESYDGSGDPMEHIATFRAQMALYDTSEVLMCRAFPTTLRGSAKTWLGLIDLDLTPLTSTFTGFIGDFVSPLGTTTIPVTFGGEPRSKTLLVSFMVVKLPSAYNAIIGRPTLNRLRTVVSTYHRILKFPTRVGVGEVRSDPRESRQCYLTATTLFKRPRTEPFGAMLPGPEESTRDTHSAKRVLELSLDPNRPDKLVKVGS